MDQRRMQRCFTDVAAAGVTLAERLEAATGACLDTEATMAEALG